VNLHEFQAKELLAQHGVPIPRGRIAANGAEAESLSRRLGPGPFVVKAQVRAGDREASGGVRFAQTAISAGRAAASMIGHPLVTAQTGPRGQQVRWAYIEEAIPFVQSLYCAVVVDTTRGEIVLLAGDNGIVAPGKKPPPRPLAISRTPLELTQDGARGDYQSAARATGINEALVPRLAKRMAQLADTAVALDATLVEVNPLAVTYDGDLVALDAKVTIDDNALFRHPDLAALHEVSETEDGDPVVLAAQHHQINYVGLDGEIGIVVNGAGLALATLDVLADAGGSAANFMDIRTTATSLDIAYGLELIAANPRVRVILVNVHGGGMQRCDTIADGIGIAMRRIGQSVPLVVRLAGNNADFAAVRLSSYGVAFTEASDIWDAAQKAVQFANG
jgi:succinyl-CoA synthetase beta subunit